MGVTKFGKPSLANQVWPTLWVGGGPGRGPEGEAPNPEKSGPEGGGATKGGAPKVGPCRVGPRRVGLPSLGGPKFRAFFPLPPQFSFFLLSLGGPSRGILGGVLKRRGPEMCTFGLSGCRVKPPVWRAFHEERLLSH